MAATPSKILNLLSTGPGALSAVNPYVDYEISFINFTSTFLVDDRAHLFTQALHITLQHSLTWSEEARCFAEDLCDDFLAKVPLPTTPPHPPPPTYQLSVDVPDDEADFFAELLMCLPQIRRLQILFHYLWRFYNDLPGYPVSDRAVVTAIYTSLIPHIYNTSRVLQCTNPAPLLSPVGPTFGPLTLANTPPPALPTSKPDTPLPALAPAPPITKPATPSALAADTPLAPLTHPKAQPCRLISGRHRRRPGPHLVSNPLAPHPSYIAACGTTPLGWIPCLPSFTLLPMRDKCSFGCACHGLGNLREYLTPS